MLQQPQHKRIYKKWQNWSLEFCIPNTFVVTNKNAGLNKKHIATNKHAAPLVMPWAWQLLHDDLAGARLQCNKPAMLMNWIQGTPCRRMP